MGKKNPKKKGNAGSGGNKAGKPAAKKTAKKAASTQRAAKRKPVPSAKPGKAAAPAKKAAAKAKPKAAAKLKAAAPRKAPAAPSADVPPAPAPRRPEGDESAGMRNVMDSLSKIFGGREFLSDADLDAFLDSKIATGEIPPSAALDPLDEAQSLVYEAWNSPEPQRARLAHRALELSSDCADAYVILAEQEAKDRKQALDFYLKGVAAGKRALGAQFDALTGRFWEAMETRPYMRARLGAAECLWDLARKEEALGHLREMISLNPADDQGVRYILIQTLLESGADDEIGKWLRMFKDDPSATLKYTHALWLFRREGAGAKADAQLAAAVKSNPAVPAFLLGRKSAPREVPEAVAPGSEEEAAAYALGALDPWRATLGALEWLSARAGRG